ncbi:MAG: acyl homoserine lactone synthase [Paracoccaceae bacterium]|jgi:acyl homoserine lactone synthase
MAIEATIKTTTLSFLNMHEYGSLFVNLLKARRDSFIVKNQWVLPESEGLEYDQYDNPSSRWVAVHQGDKVLAGIRLTPTTAKCGMYSYMIRDAQLKLVTTIPANLLDFEAPVDPDIWESSRVFVTNDVSARLRTRVQTMLMAGLIEAAAENGAKQILGLVPAVWSRWIGRLGLKAEPAGPVLEMDGWRTQVALMHLNAPAKVDDTCKTRQTMPFVYQPGRSEHEKRMAVARAAS